MNHLPDKWNRSDKSVATTDEAGRFRVDTLEPGKQAALVALHPSYAPGCVDVTCEAVQIVSPDLNADCTVNLSDLGVFGLSYNKNLGGAGYNSCCDLNDDSKCNLSDFAFMGEHYQHVCF